MKFTSMHLIALALTLVSVKFYLDSRKPDYEGPFNASGSYKDHTPLRHDLWKTAFTLGFPALVFGLAAGQKLFDADDFLNSFAGTVTVNVIAFFIYYVLVEPYVVSKTPYV